MKLERSSFEFPFEPVFYEQEMAFDVVDARSPRILRGAMTRPTLPFSAVNGLFRVCRGNSPAILPDDCRPKIRHVQRRMGVSGFDPDRQCCFVLGVSGW